VKKKTLALLAFLTLITALLAGSTMAFVLSGGRWPTAQTTFKINIPNGLANKDLWNNAFIDALEAWNRDTLFRFQYNVVETSDPCTGYSKNSQGEGFPSGNGDNMNSAGFKADLCGNSFGGTVLATTLTYNEPGTLGFGYYVEADIVFNSDYAWQVYYGDLRPNTVDFRRTALHELGHAIGLGHETELDAIMQPRLGNLDKLTPDDIAAVAKLYGKTDECVFEPARLNETRNDFLNETDCRVQDLYGQGNDDSLVDALELNLAEATDLQFYLSSNQFDTVMLLTDANLSVLEVWDDDVDCREQESMSLPAGSYYLLVNTYTRSFKCGGVTGKYSLSLSDSPYPLLGPVKSSIDPTLATKTVISGHARLNKGSTNQSSFSSEDFITIEARFDVDPEHLGEQGQIYVVAVLDDGRQYMKRLNGNFIMFPGIKKIEPAWEGELTEKQLFTVVKGLQGKAAGLAGRDIRLFLGYSLADNPSAIYYIKDPLRFSISKGTVSP
jgi:hypothetical protein